MNTLDAFKMRKKPVSRVWVVHSQRWDVWEAYTTEEAANLRFDELQPKLDFDIFVDSLQVYAP